MKILCATVTANCCKYVRNCIWGFATDEWPRNKLSDMMPFDRPEHINHAYHVYQIWCASFICFENKKGASTFSTMNGLRAQMFAKHMIHNRYLLHFVIHKLQTFYLTTVWHMNLYSNTLHDQYRSQMKRVTDVSRTVTFLDRPFPDNLFVQIILNTLECSYSKTRWSDYATNIASISGIRKSNFSDL